MRRIPYEQRPASRDNLDRRHNLGRSPETDRSPGTVVGEAGRDYQKLPPLDATCITDLVDLRHVETLDNPERFMNGAVMPRPHLHIECELVV